MLFLFIRCTDGANLETADGKSTNNLVECEFNEGDAQADAPKDVACPTQRHIPMYSIAEEDEEEATSSTTHYDDVYVTSGQPVNGGKVKPEVKPKPKVGAKSRRSTRHYENVVLHNLAESLKRKIMPRRVARNSSKNKNDQAENSSPTTNGPTENNSAAIGNGNKHEHTRSGNTQSNNNGGTAHFSRKPGGQSVEYTEVELRVPGASSAKERVQYTDVEIGPDNRVSTRSSGLELAENEVYDMQESTH